MILEFRDVNKSFGQKQVLPTFVLSPGSAPMTCPVRITSSATEET